MIDISSKFNTLRFAQAQGILKTDSTIIQSISEMKESLDNIFEIARAAAINAAKRSAEWIILGHANPIDWIAVNFELKTNTIIVNAEVKAVWKNGIELEAMTAVSAALLNLFQIISPLDQNVTISDVKIIKIKGGQEQFNDEFEKPLKTAILVISDSTFEGRRTDKSGKVIQEMLDDKSFQVAVYEVLPDNKMQISDRLKSLADDEDFDLVLTTGGTGFGPKDVTPEATLDILEKQSPGITESMRRFGKDRTPYAMLSREVAGIRGTTVIINLPGSSKGAAECMDALFPGLLHAFPMLWGGGHDEKNDGLNQKVMSDFMISVENTIRLIKENIPQREIEFVDLMDSLKRVLAEEIISPANSPSVNNSAMDGFAVRWHDLEKSSDETLRFSIIGESRAGYPFNGKMTADSAIRISTGAVVPLDADCVIPIEKCRVENNSIETQKNHKKNQHIRFAGEEFKKGQKLLDCGTQIGSAQIALLASLGFGSIKVYKKPLVSIITTGSELIPFSEKAEIYQLHDSNTPMLISAIAEAGGSVAKTFHAEDDFEQTKKVIEYATKKSQVIITSGGVSVGIHDHVRDAALELGFTELFWKVNQKPGKPMFMGKKDSLLLFALPGNPVSAFMCFKHYVRPLLQNIFGLPFDWPVIKASAKTEIKNKSNRKQFIRIRLLEVDGEKIVEPLHLQGSHMPSSIAHADGYLMLFEGQEIKANTITTVYLF